MAKDTLIFNKMLFWTLFLFYLFAVYTMKSISKRLF